MKKLTLFLILTLLCLAASTALADQTHLTTIVPSEHVLALSYSEGGQITVNGTTLTADTSIAIERHKDVVIEFTPDLEYELETATVSCDYGLSMQGNTIVIDRMVQDTSVHIAFCPITDFHILTFNANGGTGSMPEVSGSFTTYTLPECGFTPPEGMLFKAWSVNGTEYAPGTTIQVSFNLTIKAVWHRHTVVIDEAVEPTCTTSGLTAGEHCSACDEILSAQEVIPPTGHAVSVAQTVYELKEGEVVPLEGVVITCGHEGAVQLVGVSANSAKAELMDGLIYAKDTGITDIQVVATLPDGFGSEFIITVVVHNDHKMTLPAKLVEIGPEAFFGGVAEEYILSNDCSVIGTKAFANSNVKLLYIPACVIHIAPDAFENCEVSFITSAESDTEAFALEHGFPCLIQ